MKKRNFIKSGLTVIISVLVIYGVALAGTITPPSGTPTAQFYSLAEIYTRLTTNETSVEGGHDFTFSDTLTGTSHTLTEIYNVIPTIVANTVKLGTSYLGVAGTLVPSGGDATVADVLAGKTFFGDSQADWNLQTGTMTNVGAQIITPGTSTTTITQGYHDGAGYCEGDADLVSENIKSGANIFNVAGDSNVVDTSSGDAIADDILSGKKAWIDGVEITGNITTQTLSADSETVNAGNYLATTLSDVDSDLSAGNIVDGVSIFGINGSFASTTAIATTTGVEIIPSAGTWLSKVTVAITNLIASVIKKGETVGGVAGSLTPDGGDATTADLFKDKIANLTADWDLDTGTLALACATTTFDGTNNLVTDAYDGTQGDGTNRWCITDTGDATAADIATGTIAWIDGVEITGTFDPWTNQWLQTLDDWENGGGTSGEYTGEEAEWTTVSGSPFTGYNEINYSGDSGTTDLYSGEVKRDERTGLWWSDIMAIDGGGTATTTSNSFTWQGVGVRPTGGYAIGFCDALNTASFAGHNDWYLPTQKELQQAYIDGSANNLSRPNYYFWSSTELSWDSTRAWRVALGHGYTPYILKTYLCNVRCVRR